MRTSIGGAACVLAFLAGCSPTKPSDSSDTGGVGGLGGGVGAGGSSGEADAGQGGSAGVPDGGSGADSGSSGAGPGAPGWTAIPLLDDESDPQDVIFHAGNSRVTAIWYDSLEHGFIGVEGAEQTYADGGALYQATAKSLVKIAFAGRQGAIDDSQDVDFLALFPQKDGLIAGLSRSDTFISSSDQGATWTKTSPSAGQFGVEEQLAFRQGPSGDWLFVSSVGVVWKSSAAPSPSTIWKVAFGPNTVPTVPNPLPANFCQTGPHEVANGQSVHVGGDLAHVVYPLHDDVGVCMTKDGKTWLPKLFENAPAGASTLGPNGVLFLDQQNGFAYDAKDLYDDSAYVFRTTDGGDSWSRSTLPTDLNEPDARINFRQMFFAPDGTHGFIVGSRDNQYPLLLRTKDAGNTWEDASQGLIPLGQSMGFGKLYSGFALDAYHLWVGGERGALFYNEAGGD